jgi:hypothetical protein
MAATSVYHCQHGSSGPWSSTAARCQREACTGMLCHVNCVACRVIIIIHAAYVRLMVRQSKHQAPFVAWHPCSHHTLVATRTRRYRYQPQCTAVMHAQCIASAVASTCSSSSYCSMPQAVAACMQSTGGQARAAQRSLPCQTWPAAAAWLATAGRPPAAVSPGLAERSAWQQGW